MCNIEDVIIDIEPLSGYAVSSNQTLLQLNNNLDVSFWKENITIKSRLNIRNIVENHF